MKAKPKTRIYVAGDLAAGAVVALGDAQAHHLGHVLRLARGDAVALFNGRDGEWAAVIVEAGRRAWRAEARERTHAQLPEPDLWLVFASIKKTALDLCVQKATELGVSGLWPVLTERTTTRRLNQARLETITIEAAEQCGRLGVPEIFPLQGLGHVLASWPPGRRLLMMDESGAGAPIAEVFKGGPAAGGDAILIGPEGGFTTSELDAIANLAFVNTVGMGARRLRAETAAISAIACWQALIGDWRAGGPAAAAK